MQDSLTTGREIRKWLPSITQDIDFYVKQMEVPCYPEKKLEEFSKRIRELKHEYTAFLRKLKTLEPDTDNISWNNRPYSCRKRCLTEKDSEDQDNEEKQTLKISSLSDFVPIATPVLHQANIRDNVYGFPHQAPILWNANPETEDQPLDFKPRLPITDKSQHHEPCSCRDTINILDDVKDGLTNANKPADIPNETRTVLAFCTSCKKSDCHTVCRHSGVPPSFKSEVLCSQEKINAKAGTSSIWITETNKGGEDVIAKSGKAHIYSLQDALPAKTNPLNLDYSDSSSSDEI
ncbi:hypothetical protein C0Q70_17079 [Pomacea canaliculata]|uniref:Uncharacterized protein n=1 Tax=Pomacea canaliculata TaxID=400727 RepID=A0A2T7NRK0_POMCA|nr:hypothetical protein C0Q70_17079 [Pomacea canaliculata]